MEAARVAGLQYQGDSLRFSNDSSDEDSLAKDKRMMMSRAMKTNEKPEKPHMRKTSLTMSQIECVAIPTWVIMT